MLVLIFVPIASISEGGALEIVRSSKICDLVNSVLEATESADVEMLEMLPTKWAIRRDFDIGSKRNPNFLRKSPMPTTTHALWALQAMGLGENTPSFELFQRTITVGGLTFTHRLF